MNGIPPDTDKYVKGEIVEVSFDGMVMRDQVGDLVKIQYQRRDGFYEEIFVPEEFVMVKRNEFERKIIKKEHGIY